MLLNPELSSPNVEQVNRGMCMKENIEPAKVSAVSTERKAWITPDVVKIGAGEAELGANPVIAEGFFAKGS